MNKIELDKIYFGDDNEIVLITSIFQNKNKVNFKILSDPNNVWDAEESQIDWWYIDIFKESFKKAPRAYNSPLWRCLNE